MTFDTSYFQALSAPGAGLPQRGGMKKTKNKNKQTNKQKALFLLAWPGKATHEPWAAARARPFTHEFMGARRCGRTNHVAITSPQGGTDDRESPTYTFVLAGEWDQLCYRLPALVAHVSSYLATLIVLLESKLLDVTCGQFTRTVLSGPESLTVPRRKL